MANDLDEAMGVLRRKRAEHVAQIEQLDRALDALQAVASVAEAEAAAAKSSIGGRPLGTASGGASVHTKIMRLLDEGDRTWSAPEIRAEYQRRGDPIQGKKPMNALRTALSSSYKQGKVLRPEPGRYKSVKFRGPSGRPGPAIRANTVQDSNGVSEDPALRRVIGNGNAEDDRPVVRLSSNPIPATYGEEPF